VFFFNRLTSVTIPDGVTAIEAMAFCSNQLAKVAIPEGVTFIGVRAFWGNQLKSVIIPDSVTSIGSEAFAGNPLSAITIGADVIFDDTVYPYPSFDGGFDKLYNGGGRRAGTYRRGGDGGWSGP
jgi:hypothetical protein